MNFRVILAVDVLDGLVVHAQGGDRTRYGPITQFNPRIGSADPIRVLEWFRPAEVYIADLNRVMGRGDNRGVLQSLRARAPGVWMMVEYGLRDVADLTAAVEAGIADDLVVGTETGTLALLEAAAKSGLLDDRSISVSIDLYEKRVVTTDPRLMRAPLELLRELNGYPLSAVILLELDRVGTRRGLDFDFLGRAVEASDHDILCGGGVRSCEELSALEGIGVKGALVATALHDGSIPLAFIREETRSRER